MTSQGSVAQVGNTLSWLLHPVSVETFLDDVWAQSHYHIKRGCPDYLRGLLPEQSTVDALLQLFRCEPSAVRLAHGRDKKSSEEYVCADGCLDVARIGNDFAHGYTIVLDGVERYLRTVATLARSIEVELNFPVQANAYLTPPGRIGLAAHYDDHDVLILQIEGSKIWHLYPEVDVPARLIQQERDKAVAVDGLVSSTDVRLTSGDVLYVPRGRVHAAETTAEQSIHLTVGIHAPTVLMLAMSALYSHSWNDDTLNARVPPRHLDDPGLEATLRALLGEAVEAAGDPGAMTGGLSLLADGLVRRGRCPPVGRIADATAIEGHTRVQKYQPLYARVQRLPNGVALQFASLSTTAATDHEAALRFVAGRTEPFRVADLPGLNSAQQTNLVRTLIMSGFLVRLPDD